MYKRNQWLPGRAGAASAVYTGEINDSEGSDRIHAETQPIWGGGGLSVANGLLAYIHHLRALGKAESLCWLVYTTLCTCD